jgi:soluble lytic murein transglycosylase-like protein
MKHLSVIWLLAAGSGFLASSEHLHAAEGKDLDRLLDAIANVESRNDPDAVGDGGRAIGVYQIHRLYWKDGVRLLDVDWPYKEARDPRKARRVVTAYLRHYGKGKSLLDMARIHNGGPRGYRKKATLKYARKVKAAMEAAETS